LPPNAYTLITSYIHSKLLLHTVAGAVFFALITFFERGPPLLRAKRTQTAATMDEAEMRKRIFAIMTDTTLSDAEKAVKRQELMCGKWMAPAAPAAAETTSHDSGSGEGAAYEAYCRRVELCAAGCRVRRQRHS
jgi:hypothetical protein